MEFSLFSSNLFLKIDSTAREERVELVHSDGRVLHEVYAAGLRCHQTVSFSQAGYSGWIELRPGATSFLEVQVYCGTTARKQLACIELIRDAQADLRAELSGPVEQVTQSQAA